MKMLLGRTAVQEYLNTAYRNMLSSKRDSKKNLIDYVVWMKEKHSSPEPKSRQNVLSGASGTFSDFSDEELIWSVEYFDEKNHTERLLAYFSEFSKILKSQYPQEGDKIDIPPIKCIPVSEDQYIGVVPNAATFFKELRSKNLIRYNPETQRPMQKVKGDKELYKITIDPKAIRSIRECYKNKDYVPNTITLNINPNEDTIFEYDKEKSELTFKNLYYFDITDGFHRYRALCQEKDLDDKFDYPMEIRITRFEPQKATYFVWQEDQKVPMKKKEVLALNTRSAEAKIIESINGRNGFLSNKIGKDKDSFIKTADFMACCKYIFEQDENIQRKDHIANVAREINSMFDVLDQDYGKEMFGETLTELQLFIILKLIKMEKKPSFIHSNFAILEDQILNDEKVKKSTRKYSSWRKILETV